MNNSSNAIRGKARKRISKRQGIQPLRQPYRNLSDSSLCAARFRHGKQSLPRARCPRRLLCRLLLVVFQQASESFSSPHCSHVPPRLRPRKKQDPIVFLRMVALPMAMFPILLRRSPQQPRQTFFFDRLHPAFRVRVQIQASCWQLKRISS
jgi:hypothetical protein